MTDRRTQMIRGIAAMAFRLPTAVTRFLFAAAVVVTSSFPSATSPATAQGVERSPAIEVVEATISSVQEAMEEGRVTAAQLVDAYLARIAAYDQRGPRLNALIRINPNARAEAEALDRERAARGPRGPLHGIPIILKDNYDTADMPTTGASIALAGLVPPDDAFQVARLREAGAIILGKANLHELAAGITTISSLGGQTRNPYDLSRYPGGSSGGTGAAIAASFAMLGWGTDTCGSIRIPATLNNLFGLRPTKGLGSIDGIIPLSHTQDVGGPLARTATDLAIGLDATVGPDPADSFTRVLSGRTVPRFVDALDEEALRGARLGVLVAAFGEAPEDREMGDVVRAAVEQMTEAGAEVSEVDIPNLDSLVSGSSVIAHEFKFDLTDYLAATPGSPVVSLQDIIDMGLHHEQLGARFRLRNEPESRDTEEYRTALAKQAALREVVISVLEEQQLDALVYPTMRRKAAQIGEPQRGSTCQLSASTGLPALSVPAGFTDDGLPAGIELLGLPLSDARLLALGYAFEQITNPRRPPPSTPPLEGTRAPDAMTINTGGNASGIRVTARFVFDSSTGDLSYTVEVFGAAPEAVYGITLHDGAAGETGPVLYRLAGPGKGDVVGRVTLRAPERDALVADRLYLNVFTRDRPVGAVRAQLVLPPG